MLKDECDRGNVQWRMPCPVDGVERTADGFDVATPQGTVRCASLVIATGGLSVPKIGATPFGYRIAEQFGLPVVPPRPGLVPLAFAPEALARYGDLSGVSVDAEVSCNGGRFRENLLFTHRGLSGPAILQISSYWDGRTPLSIDLLPGEDAAQWLCAQVNSQAQLPTLLAQRLPRRFAQQWCAAHGVAMPMKQLGEARLREVAALLHDWRVLPSGHARVPEGGSDAAAAWPRATCRRRRWARPTFPASTSSAKWSTSPAGSAATTSSGRGRRATPPGSSRSQAARRLAARSRLVPDPRFGIAFHVWSVILPGVSSVRSSCRSPPSRSCCSFAAFGQVKVGLMVSATGPTSAIGIPQKNTGDLLPRKIGDATVEYIQLEDGGDTTRAVQNVKKLIQENNIDALIGPSTTPNALAILDFIAEAKVPMMATVGTSSASSSRSTPRSAGCSRRRRTTTSSPARC